MANVQPDQYTKIANEILEEIPKFKFNGTQLRIILVVWRYTYGFRRKQHDLSLSFLVKATGMNKDQIKREINTLIEKKVIKVVQEATFNKTRIIAFNKDYEQWQLEQNSTQGANKHTGSELAQSTGGKLATSTGGELAPQERNIKEILKEKIYIVFNHWNNQKITVHKELTRVRESAINARLKKHSVDELIKAVSNYAEIVKSDKYWYTAKFTLENFMNPKNLDRFLDENNPFETMLKNEYKKEGSNATNSQDDEWYQQNKHVLNF